MDRLIEAACAVVVVALTVIVFVQVFNRFVLKTPLAWSEDLAMLLFQWVVFLGAALGVKRMRHFGIELVVRQFPERMRHRVELLTPDRHGHRGPGDDRPGWAILGFNRNRIFSTMDLSYTWAFLPIPLGGVLILFYLIQWRSAAGGASRPPKEGTGDEHDPDRHPPRRFHLACWP